jgi:hypothetical protein
VGSGSLDLLKIAQSSHHLIGIPPPSTSAPESPERSDDEDDDEIIIPETDAERRKVLLESERDGELQKPLKAEDSWKAFKDEFEGEFQEEGQSPGASRSGSSKRPTDEDEDVIEIFSDDDNDGATSCDVPIPSGSTFTVGGVLSKSQFKVNDLRMPSTPSATSVTIGLGKIVQTEIDFRKKEALGLTPVGAVERTIGSKPSTRHASVLREDSMHITRAFEFWSCLVCTLYVSLSFIFKKY